MADENQITYTCSGPKLPLSMDDLTARINKLFEQIENGTANISEDQQARLRETRDEGAPNTFDIAGLFGLDSQGQAFVRQTCGQNITELIEAVPVDSEVHEVTCPKCGTVATVRRVPTSDLEQGEQESTQ